MGDGTKIQWTDATWNPVRGCARVSEGCRHCYAEGVAHRFSGPGQPYEGLTTEKGRWNGTVRLVPEHLTDPLRWRKPRRVFVNSMSDLFHEAIPDTFIAAVWAVMAASPTHTFQVLTKRPERARAWLDSMDDTEIFRRGQRADDLVDALAEYSTSAADAVAKAVGAAAWPLPNVWLGVSVEDQETADERIPLLLQCPAAVRWVSYEPAIGAVDFRTIRDGSWYDREGATLYDALRGNAYYHSGDHGLGGGPALDWIVVGGESGSGARRFDLGWARSVIEQTRGTSCKVFVKQLGSRPCEDAWQCTWCAVRLDGPDAPHPEPRGACSSNSKRPVKADRSQRDRKGGDPDEWPEDLRVREWPGVTS